ncbi:MAG: TRAP transporter small permease subunit [Bacteroidales bacterium]|nr:TRAP transporter small permease subunit [Bacteroidales bacterium]
MEKFEKIVNGFSRLLFYIAAAAIILMMFVTTADVIFRLFRKPITGAYELVCFFSAIAISFAIAYTTVQKGHISVNIITRLLKDVYQKIISIITNIISIVFLFFTSYQLYVYGQRLSKTGEVSLTLHLPFYYFIYSISFAMFSVCLIEVFIIINTVFVIFNNKKNII